VTDWSVEVSAELESVPSDLLAGLEAAARSVLAAEGAAEIELSIALVSDETIASINQQYLSHDGPTDVISFPLEQPGAPLVGDVYIGYEQAERQAGENGVTLDEELTRLVVHGTLHVLGWQHPDGEERSQSEMYKRQEELVRRIRGDQIR
jgi:probable rRNA maturation factor